MVLRLSAALLCVGPSDAVLAFRPHLEPSGLSLLPCRAAADNQVVGVLLAQHLTPKPGSAAQLHQLRRFKQAPQASFTVVLQRPWQAADKPVYDVIDKSQTLASQAGRQMHPGVPCLCGAAARGRAFLYAMRRVKHRIEAMEAM